MGSSAAADFEERIITNALTEVDMDNDRWQFGHSLGIASGRTAGGVLRVGK
jgi:hypothetical protein